ncbi:MAG: hypothetical protein LBS29_04450 [Endomicrobium sp.]|jgi:hypothetical protein|nr:hypothetical protein [Endomicrobium sp.]
MNLYITREDKGGPYEGLHIVTKTLKQATAKWMVLSTRWDSVFIELDDSIPLQLLSFLSVMCSDIKVKVKEDCSSKELELLCELFPEKKGLMLKYHNNALLEKIKDKIWK